MRVVAGELGGRRLAAPSGSEVRPTADRTREALFSILSDVSGLAVLDLFCGTGALAIEALSRGALRATLVDTETTPARDNIEALDLAARTELIRGDAIAYLVKPGPKFDLILCDPPYTLARALGPDLEQALPQRLERGGRIVVESPSRDPVALEMGAGLDLMSDRRYGAASLRIWRRDE